MGDESAEESDVLKFTPLGSGQEVGRSCHVVNFKGKNIMLDCGVHPGMMGLDALPFVDNIDIENIDLLLVTHFHLDHAGALPWLLQKTAFRGRCFMTHATKAIYRMLLGDYVKVARYGGGSSESRMLFTEDDLEKSMEKIEVIDFHEQKEVNGVRFWPYVAGHVLGACMFMLEVAGVRILYTGDFSRLEDRHLCAAELPTIQPDLLICESTYGTQVHEGQVERERRFTQTVHEIVSRGGRCLIPAFALGRAQELLLILDEFWEAHPELHDIPVYYASSLAKKCMAVYQTFVSGMNQRIQKQIGVNNPFAFKHVSNLKGMEHFEDVGPCVVLASPGMLQNGLSRELFEKWCTDGKNGCVIAGYCVEGTLAKHILSEPDEVTSMAGDKLPLRMQISYISFSAHTDYAQTSAFVKALKPPNVILVHGEMHEMGRLKAGLERQFEEMKQPIKIFNPRNINTVELHFRGEKTAKVVGQLARKRPSPGDCISGVLVRRNFNYHIMAPEDLHTYTSLNYSQLGNHLSVNFSGSRRLLLHALNQIAGDASELPIDIKGDDEGLSSLAAATGEQAPPTHRFSLFGGSLHASWWSKRGTVVLDWIASPLTDIYADAALAAIVHAQQNQIPDKYLNESLPGTSSTAAGEPMSADAEAAALAELACSLVGDDATSKVEHDVIRINGAHASAIIDRDTLNVQSEELSHLLSSVSKKLRTAMAPVVASTHASTENIVPSSMTVTEGPTSIE